MKMRRIVTKTSAMNTPVYNTIIGDAVCDHERDPGPASFCFYLCEVKSCETGQLIQKQGGLLIIAGRLQSLHRYFAKSFFTYTSLAQTHSTSIAAFRSATVG